MMENSSSRSQRVSFASYLDPLCDRFDAYWSAGSPLEIESLVQEVALPYRAALLTELIRVDLWWKSRSGVLLDRAEYETRFEQYLSSVENAFDGDDLGTICLSSDQPASAARVDATEDTWLTNGPENTTQIERPIGKIEDGDKFADYIILREIARGGMGVVYLAQQQSLNRQVALKMILGNYLAGDKEVHRFRAEAESAAVLDHPGIVPIFEIGEYAGRNYFTMAFIDGEDLAERANKDQFAPRQAAEMVRAVAGAVHYAHSRGIVHRDLKPANVLITREGDPKVTDFGLAKQLDIDSKLTASGDILGTPSYMAPEQASGSLDDVGPATDIYALGGLLHFLLTGRPPFKASSAMETLRQVLQVEPVPPRQINQEVDLDLQTITLKCLEKSVEKRYETAQEVVDELSRYLNGEPIQARPVSRIEKVWRWCRRSPFAAASLLLGAILLLTFSIGAPVIAYQQSQAANTQRRLRADADDARSQLQEQVEIAEDARTNAEQALKQIHTVSGFVAHEIGDPSLAALWFANAAGIAPEQPGNAAHVERFWNWSKHCFAPIFADTIPAAGHVGAQLEFDPSGRYLAVRTAHPYFAVWDLQQRRPVAEHQAAGAWSADGTLLALANETSVTVHQFPNTEQTLRRFELPKVRDQEAGETVQIRSLAFNREGTHLVSAGEQLVVWDVASGKVAFVYPAEDEASYLEAAFSPDGNYLVAHNEKERAFVLSATVATDASALHRPAHILRHILPQQPPKFSVAGELLTVRGNGERQALFAVDLEDQRETSISSFSGATHVAAHPYLHQVAISGLSGVYLYRGTEHQYLDRLINSHGDQEKQSELLEQHTNTVTGVAFAHHRTWMASISTDRTLRLWSLELHRGNVGTPIGSSAPDVIRQAAPAHAHQDEIHAVAFSPDDRFVATLQSDGLVRVLRVPESLSASSSVRNVSISTQGVRLSRDGKRFAPHGPGVFGQHRTQQIVQVFDEQGKPVGDRFPIRGLVNSVEFRPDSQHLMTVGSLQANLHQTFWQSIDHQNNEGWIKFWDWSTGELLHEAIRTDSEPVYVGSSPDGESAVVMCGAGQILKLDWNSGKVVAEASCAEGERIRGGFRSRTGVVYSPDGKQVLTFGTSGARQGATLWTDNLELIHRFPTGSVCWSAQFSSDGKWLLLGGLKAIYVYNLATRQLAAPAIAHPDWIFQAVFSPDEKTVLTACRDRTCRIWDWRTAKLASPPLRATDEVYHASFSPDGTMVATAERTGAIGLWEVATGKLLMPKISTNWRSVHEVHFLPGGDRGQRIVAAGPDRLRVISLNQGENVATQPQQVRQLAELLAGRRLIGNSEPTGMTTGKWLKLYRSVDWPQQWQWSARDAVKSAD